jgi:hypothetical protein
VATAPDTDGCECATPGCCGTGCNTVHADGLGQNFYDCNPLNTHTDPSALEACTAYAISIGGSGANCSDGWQCQSAGGYVCYGNTAGTTCTEYCWGYSGKPGWVVGCSTCTTETATWN